MMPGLWLTAFLALACIANGLSIPALALLAGGYCAVIVLDPLAARTDQAPVFFTRLRPPQMLVAMVALLAMLLNACIAR